MDNHTIVVSSRVKRFIDLMKRHIREEDMHLSDRDFVQACIDRRAKYLEEYIVDVGE